MHGGWDGALCDEQQESQLAHEQPAQGATSTTGSQHRSNQHKEQRAQRAASTGATSTRGKEHNGQPAQEQPAQGAKSTRGSQHRSNQHSSRSNGTQHALALPGPQALPTLGQGRGTSSPPLTSHVAGAMTFLTLNRHSIFEIEPSRFGSLRNVAMMGEIGEAEAVWGWEKGHGERSGRGWHAWPEAADSRQRA